MSALFTNAESQRSFEQKEYPSPNYFEQYVECEPALTMYFAPTKVDSTVHSNPLLLFLKMKIH
jgi:hypothetical protein